MRTHTHKKTDPSYCYGLDAGKIIADEGAGASHRNLLFVIVAVTHDEIAMARLFEYCDINNTIQEKCYPLSHTIKYISGGLLQPPFYIDLSRLIIKKYTSLLPLLGKRAGMVIGSIHRADLQHAIQAIQKVSTIPLNVKNRLFTVN